jgi:hypothetical protein
VQTAWRERHPPPPAEHHLSPPITASAPRNSEDLDTAAVVPDLPNCFEAADPGQPHIRDNEIEHPPGGELDTSLASLGRLYAVFTLLENGNHKTAQQIIVIEGGLA